MKKNLACMLGVLALVLSTTVVIAQEKSSAKTIEVKLSIDTEDDQPTPSKRVLYSYKSPDGRFQRVGTIRWRGSDKSKTVQLPDSTFKIVVDSKGYAPSWVQLDRSAIRGEKMIANVTLKKGIEHKFVVVDQQGNPIRYARIQPKGIVSSDLEITWRGKPTDANGESSIRVPEGLGKLNVTVVAPGFLVQTFECVADGKPDRIELESLSSCKVRVIDHDGKPVTRQSVCVISRGSTFTNQDRKNPKWRTNKDGLFEIKFDSRRPFTWALVLEPVGNRVVFTDVKLEPGGTIQLQLPKPRTVRFRINGDRSVLKGNPIKASIGVYGELRRQYNMRVPYSLSEGGSILTVHGVQDGSLSLTAKGIGSLYWSSQIEFEPEGEIIVDLDRHKERQRKFRIVFEHDGKPVKPGGQVTFYVPSPKSRGTKYQHKVLDGVAEFSGAYNNGCRDLRMISDGLVGFRIADDVDGNYEFRQKLTPLETLKNDSVQTITVPVTPAGRIAGKVESADGEPLDGTLQCQMKSLVGRKRSLHGYATRVKVKEGSFEISPVPFDSSVELQFGKFGDVVFGEFTMTESNPDQRRTITLPKTESTSIQLLMPTGEPAKKCLIHVYRKSDTNFKTKKRTGSNGLGVFDLALERKDDYRFRVSTPKGYQQVLETSIQPGAKIELSLKEGSRLSGSVVNEKGFSIAQMSVQALNDDGKVVDSAMTDHEGLFELTRLPLQAVRLRGAHISGKVTIKLTLPIKPGSEKKLNLKAIDKRNLISG